MANAGPKNRADLFAIENTHTYSESKRGSSSLRPVSLTPSIERCRFLGASIPRPLSYADNDKQNSVGDGNIFQYKSATQKKEQNIEPTADKAANLTSFSPGYRFYLAFASLSIIAMMVALDGTSVSVALPVRPIFQI